MSSGSGISALSGPHMNINLSTSSKKSSKLHHHHRRHSRKKSSHHHHHHAQASDGASSDGSASSRNLYTNRTSHRTTSSSRSKSGTSSNHSNSSLSFGSKGDGEEALHGNLHDPDDVARLCSLVVVEEQKYHQEVMIHYTTIHEVYT
jgi:hypothetical protein